MHHVPNINTLQSFLNFAHAYPLTQRRLSYSLKVLPACPRRKYPSECRKTPVEVQIALYWVLPPHLLEVAYESLLVARQRRQEFPRSQ